MALMALNLDPLPAKPYFGWPYGHRDAVAGGLRCLRASEAQNPLRKTGKTRPGFPRLEIRKPRLDLGNCFGVGVRVQSKASLFLIAERREPASRLRGAGGPRRCGRCGAGRTAAAVLAAGGSHGSSPGWQPQHRHAGEEGRRFPLPRLRSSFAVVFESLSSYRSHRGPGRGAGGGSRLPFPYLTIT